MRRCVCMPGLGCDHDAWEKAQGRQSCKLPGHMLEVCLAQSPLCKVWKTYWLQKFGTSLPTFELTQLKINKPQRTHLLWTFC